MASEIDTILASSRWLMPFLELRTAHMERNSHNENLLGRLVSVAVVAFTLWTSGAIPAAASATPQPGATAISSANRIGIGYASSDDEMLNKLRQQLFNRLVADYLKRTDVVFVPLPVLSSAQFNNPADACKSANVLGLLRFDAEVSLSEKVVQTHVYLLLSDCGGIDAFEYSKKGVAIATHGAMDGQHQQSAASESVNSMLTEAEKGLSTYLDARSPKLLSLLSTGLALDPSDPDYHDLFQWFEERDGTYDVGSLFPGGPADVAGLKSGDVIVAIAGTAAKGQDSDKLAALTNVPSYTIQVNRGGTVLMLTVKPLRYGDLVRSMHR